MSGVRRRGMCAAAYSGIGVWVRPVLDGPVYHAVHNDNIETPPSVVSFAFGRPSAGRVTRVRGKIALVLSVSPVDRHVAVYDGVFIPSMPLAHVDSNSVLADDHGQSQSIMQKLELSFAIFGHGHGHGILQNQCMSPCRMSLTALQFH